MITKTIKIYTWSDFKYWFWNKFFFPRRKTIVEWLTYHDDRNREEILEMIMVLERLHVKDDCDIERINAIDLKLKGIFDKQRKESEKIIMGIKSGL